MQPGRGPAHKLSGSDWPSRAFRGPGTCDPADFLPESLLGPVGLEDDLLIMALAVFRLLEGLPSHVVLESWEGDDNLLKLIPAILDAGEDMVGRTLWRRLREWVGDF